MQKSGKGRAPSAMDGNVSKECDSVQGEDSLRLSLTSVFLLLKEGVPGDLVHSLVSFAATAAATAARAFNNPL